MSGLDRSLRCQVHLAVEELARLDRELAHLAVLLDRDAVLRGAAKLLTEAFGLHAAWIAEQDGAGGVLIKHASGESTGEFHGAPCAMGTDWAARSSRRARSSGSPTAPPTLCWRRSAPATRPRARAMGLL